MALTDKSDLFASVNEDGINRFVRHLMRQRPSLFNYGTAAVEEDRNLLCVDIDAAREVLDAGNPLIDIQDGVPVLGAPMDLRLNWCLQLTDVEVDFHPGNVISLPPELDPLEAQRAAVRLRACFGLDCPSEDVIQELLPGIEVLATKERKGTISDVSMTFDKVAKRTYVLPTRRLMCFCLEIFAVLHVEWGTIGGTDESWLKVRLDGLEIVDLRPRHLEDLIECYVRTVLRLGILPRLSVKIETLVLDITKQLRKLGLAIGESVRLEPAPVPASVPNNPAIEDDELKVFVDLVIEGA